MKALIFLIVICYSNGLKAQEPNNTVFDTIPFSIVRISSEIDFEQNEMIPSKYIVWLDISEESFAKLKTRSNSSWLELLSDNKTFFDTYLTLYALHEIDIEVLTTLEQSQWENYFKSLEPEYWKTVLLKED